MEEERKVTPSRENGSFCFSFWDKAQPLFRVVWTHPQWHGDVWNGQTHLTRRRDRIWFAFGPTFNCHQSTWILAGLWFWKEMCEQPRDTVDAEHGKVAEWSWEYKAQSSFLIHLPISSIDTKLNVSCFYSRRKGWHANNQEWLSEKWRNWSVG